MTQASSRGADFYFPLSNFNSPKLNNFLPISDFHSSWFLQFHHSSLNPGPPIYSDYGPSTYQHKIRCPTACSTNCFNSRGCHFYSHCIVPVIVLLIGASTLIFVSKTFHQSLTKWTSLLHLLCYMLTIFKDLAADLQFFWFKVGYFSSI